MFMKIILSGINQIYAVITTTRTVARVFHLTLYGPNSFFFVVFRDIALDRLFSSTDS